jgi:hypothetical protein
MAYELVLQEVTTWERLEAAGKVAPRRRTAKEWLLTGMA